MTLKELSSRTGIRERYLQKIELGKAYRFSICHLVLIAAGLNVEESVLVKGL